MSHFVHIWVFWLICPLRLVRGGHKWDQSKWKKVWVGGEAGYERIQNIFWKGSTDSGSELIGLNRSLILEKTQPNPPTPTPPDRGQTFSQPNHARSSPNFQDIFPILYQHDLWCQRWPHPPSLQSGTLNVLQAPNLCFLSQIMLDFHQLL